MTSAEVTTVAGGRGALALRGDQVDWDDTQRAALAQIGVAEAPRGDQLVLLHVAQRTGLDPFARQIYMIGRKDNEAPGGKKWTIQTGIDGFRVISERHPQYAGVGDTEWCGEDGVWRDVWVEKKPPVAARFTVYRRDWDHPVRAVAHFEEYAQKGYNGEPQAKWRTSPALMIAKCSEALARRRAFPQDLAAVYSDEEMEHVDNPPPVVGVMHRIDDPERDAARAAEPDWDALVRDHEAAGDAAKLWDLRKLAQGMRPNDGALLNKIAEAWTRTKAAANATAQGTSDQPAEKAQKNRLFALLRDGAVSGDDRAVRLRIVNRVLNRPPAEPVTSFGDLSAADVETVNAFLQCAKDGDVLTHTLADLGAAAPAKTETGEGPT